MKKFKLTLELEGDYFADETLDLVAVANDLTHDRWEDGRYPFSQEMFIRGLNEMLRNAVWEVKQTEFSKLYPTETIELENGSMSKSCFEAEKWMKNFIGINVESPICKAKMEQ